jgi:hypothetical protein
MDGLAGVVTNGFSTFDIDPHETEAARIERAGHEMVADVGRSEVSEPQEEERSEDVSDAP